MKAMKTRIAQASGMKAMPRLAMAVKMSIAGKRTEA